jgi:hypothetical protein
MVKNQAFVGESGNRKLPRCEGETGQSNDKCSYKKRVAVTSVIVPIMIMSLKERELGSYHEGVMYAVVYHCHGSNPAVWICRQPKLTKPERI